MKDIKTRTERLSDERHSLVFQLQLGGELHILKEALQLDNKVFLNTVIFGHHVLMCGSTTRGLNFSQFSEYQIFGRKCAEYQILSKTSDLLNILTYTK